MSQRIVYARYRDRERANDALEDMLATGDVCEDEHPTIEYERGWWCVVLYYFCA